ncbi:MAG: hypothetical protein KDH96_13510, partial [Candidatus Riesia sp.]|nr:hypothetical protein [Candidatus Riesia sp.]
MEPAELIGVNKDDICYIWKDLHSFFVGKDLKYKPWSGNGSGKASDFRRKSATGKIIIETE